MCWTVFNFEKGHVPYVANSFIISCSGISKSKLAWFYFPITLWSGITTFCCVVITLLQYISTFCGLELCESTRRCKVGKINGGASQQYWKMCAIDSLWCSISSCTGECCLLLIFVWQEMLIVSPLLSPIEISSCRYISFCQICWVCNLQKGGEFYPGVNFCANYVLVTHHYMMPGTHCWDSDYACVWLFIG